MPALFDISILTHDQSIYSGKVSSLVAPGEIGYLGVLANHAPLITSLVPGNITMRDATDKTIKFTSNGNGFLEILKNKVTLLLDSVEPKP